MHERAMELLSIFHMEHLADAKASSLPYGAQRRLEIVRALASGPLILLLDEPAAGMNPQESEELLNFIRRLRDDFGLTIDQAREFNRLLTDAQAASSVQANQFNANWLASSNATGYYLDVATNASFTGGNDAVELSE